MSFYFDKFEDRKPPEPVPHSPARELLFQTLAVAAVALGVWYLGWRWTSSLNWNAWWLSVPLVIAETLSFAGTILFFLSIWRTKDTPQNPVPKTVNDILETPLPDADDRPLAVDVFFPTYNEDVELVRLSIRDAKKMTYPHPIDLRVWVLDDGKRPEMRAVADEEGVGYITRTNNVGYKAGNMRNALDQTSGDLLVICDADTRPLPHLLTETLGYFRDREVAWVQTPQWFYDLEEGTPLPDWFERKLGKVGRGIGRGIEFFVGEVRLGADPLGNDARMFYDVIQRRRNWANASFCCGAGSVHRREAVMEAALKAYSDQIDRSVQKVTGEIDDETLRGPLGEAMTLEAARDVEVTPYKFHVSEDIYTSIVLHADVDRNHKSVFHPRVCSKMLSPQDLLTWSIQRFKYAGGTLDIFLNDNWLNRKGLSTWQKLLYTTSAYSYMAPLWVVVFLLAPVIYLFSGVSPLSAYNDAFYAHLLPFLVVNKLAFVAGTWGVPTWRGEQHYLGFFWLNLKAMRDVVLGRPVKFHVTPKTRQAGNFYGLVWPQLAIVGLSLVGMVFMGVRVFGLHHGDPGAYLANLFWTLANMLSLSAIIFAARRPQTEEA